MNIITSVMPLDYTMDESSGSLKIQGIFQKAETRNENGRYYPRAILEREVAGLQKIINENRLIGELGHPQTAEINLERGCHKIESLVMEGLDVIGKAKIIKGTPYGSILEAYLKEGIMLGISSRGKGSTSYRNGMDEVNEDYKMITFDTVARPSTPDAFPTPLVESVEEKNGHFIKLNTLVEKTLSGEINEKDLVKALKWEKGKKLYFIK